MPRPAQVALSDRKIFKTACIYAFAKCPILVQYSCHPHPLHAAIRMRNVGLSAARLYRHNSTLQSAYQSAAYLQQPVGASVSRGTSMGKLHRSRSKPLGAGIGSELSRRAAQTSIPSLQTKCAFNCADLCSITSLDT